MIEEQTAKVWYSPARGRRFLSKRAAIKAEAASLIEQRYPTEPQERDNIGVTYAGFHWHSLPRAHVLHRRLCRIIASRGIDQ